MESDAYAALLATCKLHRATVCNMHDVPALLVGRLSWNLQIPAGKGVATEEVRLHRTGLVKHVRGDAG